MWIVSWGIKLLQMFNIIKNIKHCSVENCYLFINTSVWKKFVPVKDCNRTSDKLPFLDLYDSVLRVNKEEGKTSSSQIMNK